MKLVSPDIKYNNIELKDFGRRPTDLEDIQGLLTLCDKTDGNILEIGAWYGKTTYELASRFPEKTFHTLDFLEITHKYECANTTRSSKKDLCKYAIGLPNVKLHYIRSKDFDYYGKNISMVFVDGDHGYEGCKLDTELALLNLPKNSIIAWHDVLNPGFGVKSYLKKEIEPFYEYHVFENSQVGFIKI